MTRIEIQRLQQELQCDSGPSMLGVHEISEYVFCPCAGILATESTIEDDGSEFVAAPWLGGIPLYEVDRIEAEIERLQKTLRVVLGIYASAFAAGVVTLFIDKMIGVVFLWVQLVFAIVAGANGWWMDLKRFLYCHSRLRDFLSANSREPDWTKQTEQKISWWELLQAGYESRELTQSLSDDTIGLKGKPWRILKRGDMTIPVLRIASRDDDRGKEQPIRLTQQQRARIGAYAYLCSVCLCLEVTWAIVIIGKSDKGVAIPIGSSHWDALSFAVKFTRDELRRINVDKAYEPQPSSGDEQCKRCPHGKPRRIGLQPTILGGQSLQPYAIIDRVTGVKMHSSCGDRFRCLRPHEDADQFGVSDSQTID